MLKRCVTGLALFACLSVHALPVYAADTAATTQAAEAAGTAMGDLSTFQTNTAIFLAASDPSRVYRPANPGAGVPVIAAVASVVKVAPNGQVTLAVKAVDGAPVTFATQDGGEFANNKSAITVLAGDDGIAQAVFTATPGTVAWVNILAASPMTASRAHIAVQVLP